MLSDWIWRLAWLLLPAAWVAEHLGAADAVTFCLSALSLIPLAKSMGDATDALAERMGPATGSLLNATFGNAAELILGIAALRHGHIALVKGSITGSILGNLLLVAGASIVTGGLRWPTLRFNKLAATSSVSILFLALIAIFVPTLLSNTGHGRAGALLSEEISVVLVVMYALTLVFQLRTHRKQLSTTEPPRAKVYATPGEAAAAPRATTQPHGPAWPHVALLLAAATATAAASELLVGTLEGTLTEFHLPEIFVGVIIVAIVGNAAEHSTAMIFAHRGDMDVALGIPWESSKQIALFVAPVLVFAGHLLGAPMDLAFSRFEVAAVGLAVIAVALISLDGESNWLEGAFLLAVYVVLGIGFYFVAAPA